MSFPFEKLLQRIKRRRADWFPPTVPRGLGAFRQVLVGETSQPASRRPSFDNFSRFSAIGTLLELKPISTRDEAGEKREIKECRIT
jgi:hypothetical protein